MQEVILIVISYFIGCFCTGYYLIKFFHGKDIRTLGSKNPGARNVGRQLGTVGFVTTLLGDAGKSYGIVLVVASQSVAPYFQIIALIMAIVGHIWPIQLGFRGGKGYATMAGGLLAYDFVLFLLLLSIASLIALILRRITLSGLIAISLSPVLAFFYGEPIQVVSGFAIIAALLVYAHRSNIHSTIVELQKSSKNET